jgi:hypothetical protein
MSGRTPGDVDRQAPVNQSRPGCAKRTIMSQSASKYPISQLINRLMQERGYTTIDLVRSLGYRNTERGLRRLEPWLEQGDGFQKLLKQIGTAYGQIDQIAKTLAETKALKAKDLEARRIESCKAVADSFHPYLHVDGENTVPSGICIFGMTGGHRQWTTIPISQNVLDLSGEQQLAALRELMKGYRKTYNGAVPFFGKLTGFKFVRLLDYLLFDIDGQFIEEVNRPFRSAPCTVQLL